MRANPRWTAIGVVMGLLAGVVVAVAAPAAATPEPGKTPIESHRVTLITGDRVTLTGKPGGRQAAGVEPAKGRERVEFLSSEVDGAVQIMPADMVPYVERDLLDERLFSVDDLIEQSYDDAATKRLPLLLSHDGAAGVMRGIPGVKKARWLESAGAQAVAAAKGDLAAFWKTVEPRLGKEIDKVWLDGKVEATLDESVPQVGAPEAWAAGYEGDGVEVAILDTGVDAGHPDLEERITEQRNFTAEDGPQDGHGHGTHVASTAGAVAPRAELINGKVLDDGGRGYESDLIDGMEWAAPQADVVNMSLGGPPTDGTDPLSVAVDRLTEETGALFVIAAGNNGTDYSVGTPGAAASALTVGAVDREDGLAAFSSRGPRLDEAPKPDITAPGVGIVAARAKGTSLGRPVDELRTAASGTSMATPHVAGAAALVKQQREDSKAGDLKDALVSSAEVVDGQTVFQQGGGRLDVARAVRQGVSATGVLNLGVHEDGDGERAGKEIAYNNAGDEPVTLKLALEVGNLDGDDPADGAIALDDKEITIEPGESGTVEVTADTERLAHGRYAGYVTAEAGGVALHTTLTLTRNGRKHKVHFKAVDGGGEAIGSTLISMYGAAGRDDVRTFIRHADREKGKTVEVTEGTYMTQALLEKQRTPHPRAALTVLPEFTVDRDMEVLLDARTTVPVEIEFPEPVDLTGIFTYHTYRTYGDRKITQGVMKFSSHDGVDVTPTRPVRNGSFEFASRWQYAAPRVRARVRGGKPRRPLNPPVRPIGLSPEMRTGRHSWPLVDGGDGEPEDLEGLDLKGRAVALANLPVHEWDAKVENAAEAGAAAAFIVASETDVAWQPWSVTGDRLPIPAMMTAYDHGQLVLDRAAAGGAALDVRADWAQPYFYDVMQRSPGRVPERIVHRVNRSNTARIETSYQETGTSESRQWAKEQRFGWHPWQRVTLDNSMEVQRVHRTGHKRVEHVSAGDGSVWRNLVQHMYTWEDMNSLRGGLTEPPRSYRGGERIRESWFAPIVRPAIPRGARGAVRSGDTMRLRIPEFVDAAGKYGYRGGSGERDATEARLLRDGELVHEADRAWGDFPAVKGPAEYRLELTTERSSGEWRRATATTTAWTFRSDDSTDLLPLLQVDYEIPADLRGRVRSWLPVPIGMTVRHQDGPASPRVRRLTAELSYDEGRTWHRVPVLPLGRGRYRGLFPHAADKRVTLRVTAVDSAGNKVAQTVENAYETS